MDYIAKLEWIYGIAYSKAEDNFFSHILQAKQDKDVNKSLATGFEQATP